MAKTVDIRYGESVSIDDGRVLVTLEEKSGQRARLRFEAGPSVKIERVTPKFNIRARLGLDTAEK
jgi:hypothetical protein